MNLIDGLHTMHCVNLQQRKDRWQKIQLEHKKLQNILPNISLQRVDAIVGTPPRQGLTDTIKGIVQSAKEDGLPYVLIVEDDLWVIDPTHIKDALSNVPDDWDLLLGGAYTLVKTEKINDWWMSVKTFCGTHFIIIRSTIYDEVLEFSNPYPIDRLFSDLKHRTILVMNPMPCRQRGGYSDIRKQRVNYNDRNLPFSRPPQ